MKILLFNGHFLNFTYSKDLNFEGRIFINFPTMNFDSNSPINDLLNVMFEMHSAYTPDKSKLNNFILLEEYVPNETLEGLNFYAEVTNVDNYLTLIKDNLEPYLKAYQNFFMEKAKEVADTHLSNTKEEFLLNTQSRLSRFIEETSCNVDNIIQGCLNKEEMNFDSSGLGQISSPAYDAFKDLEAYLLYKKLNNNLYHTLDKHKKLKV